MARVSGAESERYWDARARENALYFVDNRLDYDDPDVEAFWRDGEETLERLQAILGFSIGSAETVVDIGCGVGRLTRALAGRARKVYGLDVSREMLTRAREASPDLDNVEWLHGDGTTLSVLPDASVDGCVSHVVFQHLPEPQMTLGYVREMGRVLRPGGWTAFQVSTDPRVHARRPPLRELLGGWLGRSAKGLAARAWRGSAIDLNDLRAVARESGLEIERTVGEGTQYTLILARRR